MLQKKHIGSLLIGQEEKRRNVHIKDMRENILVLLFYKVSVEKEIIKRHIKDCFKINSKQVFQIPKKKSKLISKILNKE